MIERLCYRALGVRKEFPELNLLAVTLMIIKTTAYTQTHHPVFGGYPLPRYGGAILVANHQDEGDSYKGFQLGRTVGRVIRTVARTSLIAHVQESAEVLARTGHKSDELNKYSPIRAFVLRGVGVIPVVRGAPDRAFIRTFDAVIKSHQLAAIFIQETRVNKGDLRDLKTGPSFFVTRHPDISVYPVGFFTEGVNVGRPFTYTELLKERGVKKIGMADVTLEIADRIAQLLPERAQQDWITRRTEESSRLRPESNF